MICVPTRCQSKSRTFLSALAATNCCSSDSSGWNVGRFVLSLLLDPEYSADYSVLGCYFSTCWWKSPKLYTHRLLNCRKRRSPLVDLSLFLPLLPFFDLESQNFTVYFKAWEETKAFSFLVHLKLETKTRSVHVIENKTTHTGKECQHLNINEVF